MRSSYFFVFLVSVVFFCGCVDLDAHLTGIPVVEQNQTTGWQPEPGNGSNVYFFYSPSCPYCIKEKAFLEELEGRYPDVRIDYIIASENWDLFAEVCECYNTTTSGVPRTFIGDKAFIGFSSQDCDLRFNEAYRAYIGCPNQIENAVNEI
ncbi:MAG: thioredoxin family protein [Candidatus Altiarchaeota archaeon]|nr:thioredoxin family protein [Candidatus Altiarchaeota archaeon]